MSSEKKPARTRTADGRIRRATQKKEDAGNNYVDKKEFSDEMIEWKERWLAAKEAGEPTVPLTNSIGKKIMLIAEGVSRMKNFSNYTYKDEMILDGIENCIRYAHNFNPEKSTNAFAYFTTSIYYAFIRRIGVEKKQGHIKKKCIELAIDDPRYNHDLGSFGTSAGAIAEVQKKLSGEIMTYEESLKKKKSGKGKKKSGRKRKTSSSSSSSSSNGDNPLF